MPNIDHAEMGLSNRSPNRHETVQAIMSDFNDRSLLDQEQLTEGLRTIKSKELLESMLVQCNDMILTKLIRSHSVYEVADRIESALAQRGIIEMFYQLSMRSYDSRSTTADEPMTP